jgi:hypothetical protein
MRMTMLRMMMKVTSPVRKMKKRMMRTLGRITKRNLLMFHHGKLFSLKTIRILENSSSKINPEVKADTEVVKVDMEVVKVVQVDMEAVKVVQVVPQKICREEVAQHLRVVEALS